MNQGALKPHQVTAAKHALDQQKYEKKEVVKVQDHVFKKGDHVNFAELADLVPDDGEKQLRIASVDLNTAKQCYEAYRHSLMKNKPEEAAAEMKVFSEDDYIDTARETTEQYMQNVMSDEMKERFKQYEGLDAAEMEKEIMKWDCVIKDSKGFECQALRANMAYSELSIDKATLVDSN